MSATTPLVVVTFTLLFGAAAAICVLTSFEILLSDLPSALPASAVPDGAAAGAFCAAGAGVWGASVLATGGAAAGAGVLAAVLLAAVLLLEVSELPAAGCLVLATESEPVPELLSLECLV